MILEKFVIVFVSIVLLFFLCMRYVKRYEPINLVIVPLLSVSISIYIPFALYSVYIPIFLQIFVMLFAVIIPSISVFLQYNNIIINRKILYYRMKLSYSAEDFRKTITLIEKLVSIEGKKSYYLYLLGMCYKNLRDDINARDSFALATEIDKKDYKSYYELGLVLDETNKKEVAMVMFDKALKINPNFYEAHEALGICLTSQGRFKEALKVYREAIKKYPDSYELYYNVAIIELELRNNDLAEEAFKKAGEIKPDLYTAYYNLGNLYYIKGDYDSCIEAYKNILTSGVYGPKGYYKLAVVYAAKREYDKAMSSLEYAIELDPKYINKSKEELLFENIRSRINDYLEDRKRLEEEKLQKRNYMRDKFNIFKKRNIETVEKVS